MRYAHSLSSTEKRIGILTTTIALVPGIIAVAWAIWAGIWWSITGNTIVHDAETLGALGLLLCFIAGMILLVMIDDT